MPPLPLLGALLDTAGTALKAARGAGASSAAGNDAATATTAVPFAQTLKQSVTTRRDASNADVPDASTQQASSKPAAGTKPSAADDDDTTDDTTANAATNPNAAALAAAAAVQAQLQARTDNTVPADAAAAAAAAQKTAVTGQPDATATLADHAARDAAAQTTQATPATSRDALQEALARLTGGSGAIAMPAAGTTASAPASTAATATAVPLAPKVPTFDRTLADAKGALATQQAPAQATAQALQANANAQSGEQHALAAASGAADPAASATLAAGATAAAAAQANLQLSPAAGAIAAANAHVLAPHVSTPDWTDALSQKVVFLSNAHQQSAELTLNPADLGPLQVVLRVADNNAHALFVSQHPQVREAVEAALPKLREAMEAGGLGLGSATVSDGGFASQQQNPQQTFAHGQPSRRGSGGSSAGDAPVGAAQPAPAAASVSRAGLVDTFA
ncbi:flagellar hook-length control protein [Burkholderia contaminans FFH2055]|uniref:flagellar hook-length control protein FliK n=1 Tax=Burkholderia contaminans TaxID=488447 RepID=UPI000625A62B|nr:flagellar hook-length control protein FliK [Burkholderia contaminans]KKL36732.1 flagellar hook-length control protein [Burkholderia contaminans FFH2055]MEB4633603.1 flagellar hook-length control protein FliK [Burkholderia contaminans]MEB4638448.1 flagellar hook-length control protein FliK [Burkholderia contaminans]MEB4655048.1 flagellar hook-length control protein FliK [Burkholderia contaminans]MEB4663048.1 flagellar hook-length control protein FliK [Burkholderia contaminans]